MPDLTDSYCERCGSHYVFNPNAPKPLSLKGARVLAKGLRNFVMTDGQSLSDSMRLARHDDDHENSSRMTEAFYRAFNFCMTCRQYACEKCWNVKQGACLTCAPEPESDPVAQESHLIVRMPVTRVDESNTEPWVQSPWPPLEPMPVSPEAPAGRAYPELSAWPSIDLTEDQPEVPSMQAEADQPADSAADGQPVTARKAPEWLARRSSRDGETAPDDKTAWSLWPIADPLAPEMTLTPEELTLVESQLGRADGAEAVDESQAAQPAAMPTMPVAWQSEASELEPADQLRAQPEAPASPLPIQNLPPDLAASAEVGPVPQPQPMEKVPARPIVLPFFGRASRPAAPSADDRRREPPRGTPSDSPWPHPTPWAERPIAPEASILETADQLETATPGSWAVPEYLAQTVSAADSDATASAAASATPTPLEPEPIAKAPRADTVPAAAFEPAVLPVEPPTIEAAPIEPSGAELATPEPATSEPAGVEPARVERIFAFDPVAGSSVGQPDLQPAAIEAPFPAPAAAEPPQEHAALQQPLFVERAARSSDQAEAAIPTAQPEAAPPSNWPPLGASWPSTAGTGPVWPAPAGPTPSPAILSSQGAPGMAEMWAQSAQEVLNRGSVRVCHHCGLPVSTHARFCRRCGKPQI